MGKLKKFLLLGLYSLFIAGIVKAAVVKYNAYLANETALAYNKTYMLPLNQFGVDYLSFTSIASSATIASVTVDMPAFTLNGTGVGGSNTFPIALPVLYTTTVTVGGLTNNSTYYATGNGSKAFFLSKTSTDAIAGNFITFTSTTAGTGYSLTFAPLGITGTPSYKWQVSNDGSNWVDYTVTDQGISVSSVTLTSYVSTGTVTAWDFGEIQYAWIRLNVIGPTNGGIKLQVVGNGKNSSN